MEIMRVTRREARIYPTVTSEAQLTEYVPMLRADPALREFAFAKSKLISSFLRKPIHIRV
jgi:hypothetical protein